MRSSVYFLLISLTYFENLCPGCENCVLLYLFDISPLKSRIMKKALRFLALVLDIEALSQNFITDKLLRDSATDAAVSGVCSSYLGRVSRVLLGLNSIAEPHLKFSVSLFPAQATSADFMYTHKGTDSTQPLWSLTVSCQVRVLLVAPDEAFSPSGNAFYYSARPEALGIVYALLLCYVSC